ncbi:hypothetical protein OEZ86_011681 [Tetradesmus obliquus]|nr:hypothetical protein OEZ86_011681 [Tetradesmus obliquus]
MRKSDRASDVLKIGVIIPSLNEEHTIKETLQSVAGKGICEVLVVDGGSSDRTVKVAKAHGAKVIKAPRGRGPQLNAGWRASKADWCLFLHADTQLPDDFPQLITHAVQQQQQQQQQQQGWHLLQPRHQASCWGCFRSIRLTQVPGWQAWLTEVAVSLRTLLLRMPYGDQALFVRREALEAVQGFPDWRVLEDVGIVQQLNRLSPPAIVPRTVVTSGRKYQALGFWRTVASHQAIMLGWAAGLRHQQLLQLYDACSNARKG